MKNRKKQFYNSKIIIKFKSKSWKVKSLLKNKNMIGKLLSLSLNINRSLENKQCNLKLNFNL